MAPRLMGTPKTDRAKLLHRAATVPLTARQLPDERRQPGPIPIAVLRRQRGFEETATSGTARLVQDDMRHVHLDLGQLDHLVGIVRRRRRKLLLPTGTGLRLDLDDLRGRQQRLAMPRMSRLRAWSPLRGRGGGPLSHTVDRMRGDDRSCRSSGTGELRARQSALPVAG